VSDPQREYDRRIVVSTALIERAEREHLVLAVLRVGTAAAAVGVGILIVRGASPWWMLVPALVFTLLVAIHARVLLRADRARRARALYERGIERVTDRWSGRGHDGARFLAGHPYARDLDLFGPGSLFQRLDAARTQSGEAVLAAWLSSPAPIDEVRSRQRAVDELRTRLDFRESIAVLADEASVPDVDRLIAWAESPPVAFPRFLTVLLVLGSVVAVGLIVEAYRGAIAWSLPVAWILLEQAVVAFTWRSAIHGVLHRMATPEHDLELLSGLLERIERERFDAPALVERQAVLLSDVPASRLIGRLRQMVSLLESSTHNLFAVPITRTLLVPEQLAIAIGQWHVDHGRSVAGWIRAAAEFEALASLAAYAYERPGDPFPTLLDEGAIFDSSGLGHPLMADAVSVRNDVRLGGDAPQVLVVSGSNMSGKSTMLRAVGVNIVLALAGAPVRASALRLSALTIGATLRVDDSLQEGHSRFYAEILRLRDIVDRARRGAPVIFLLDEILHGTNSYDRRLGAEGIVRGLLSLGAIGLVTTHDLALTELVTALGPVAANVHFEDRLEDSRMTFDYRMRPGVVEHSNALALMRTIGLDV